MPRQVIILNTAQDANGNQNINYIFWLTVGANKQLPNPAFVSAYRGATAAEVQSLQSGLVVEQTGVVQYPTGTSQASIRADLQSRWGASNTAFQATPNTNQFFGESWDGATWTAAPATPPPVKLSRYQLGTVQINTNGANNTVIPATAGQSISILRMKMIATAAVTVTVKDGAGATLFGPFPMVTGVQVDFNWSPEGEPWFVTSAGNALMMTLSSAVVVSISGSYSKG